MGETANSLVSPEFLVVLAGACHAIGYLITNQMMLRISMLIGTGFYIFYYAVVSHDPLWIAIWTSIVLATANVTGMLLLAVSRSRLIIPSTFKDVYRFFPSVPPGEFRQLMKLSRRYVAREAEIATREGEPVEKLFFIVSGGMAVEKRGEKFLVPSGVFVGEVAFLLNQPASATTILDPGSDVLVWDVAVLRKNCAKRPRFRLALEAMISNDLAAKVSFAVAPKWVTDQQRRSA
ncbi:MAG: cyclic nucleotide-binding domain-containing protein [Pseudomonadota bacterium]